ncbi:MAG: 16S rRNA (guanine(966)-N(2))-methyltransferase RsmD [Clostridia bacterium]|nr:16S rRNA (guanine(966)-N(2))-methyltransferase RsmD [Clostridia bacterium]
MRIITGAARGTKLETLEGEATRPTSERAKEAIFSCLQFDLEGRTVLDLFAGSGQMGLEALSRGAASCMFVDSSPDAMAVVKENAKKTGFFDRCRYLISDYRSYLRKAAGRDRYSLVILDPPYADRSVGDCLARILAAEVAVPGCMIVCESGEEDVFAGREELAARFVETKRGKYGPAYVRILSLRPSETEF